MAKKTTSDLISNQTLLLSFLKDKLDTLNFIVFGYENNFPFIKNNYFIHSMSHIYYRSIIIDICALFHKHRNEHNNFYLLIDDDKQFKKHLKNETVKKIIEKLQEASKYFSEELSEFRNCTL